MGLGKDGMVYVEYRVNESRKIFSIHWGMAKAAIDSGKDRTSSSRTLHSFAEHAII
jgi:hypothetical protein